MLQQFLPLAVLKPSLIPIINLGWCIVATVLTACSIETMGVYKDWYPKTMLQQFLPLAVLKRSKVYVEYYYMTRLQQFLPLAVLKLCVHGRILRHADCCNSSYRLQYWNVWKEFISIPTREPSCNSSYRLQYWNAITPSSSAVTFCCNSSYRLQYWNMWILA